MNRRKAKFVEVSEEFKLSKFKLSGVNYYKKYCQIQRELDLVEVNKEFELSEFELARDYCIIILFYKLKLLYTKILYFLLGRKREEFQLPMVL